MSDCQTCGRPAENGQPTHWLGCTETLRHHARNLVEPDFTGSLCEHRGCSQSKWSDGPRTKYCADHKDPKSREK
jgi:hypothetical protein